MGESDRLLSLSSSSLTQHIQARLSPKGKHLRLAVKGGEGCDGFTYEFVAEEETKVEASD